MIRIILLIVVAVAVAGLFGACQRMRQAPSLRGVDVPMRDGVRLAADVYLPDGEGPFPVVLARSVYGRGDRSFAAPFVQDGLAFVVQDTRGRGGSEGTDRVFADDAWGELRDGADTVDWVLGQQWCNGDVGTWGGSALGIVQVLVAPVAPKLRAQSILVASSRFYGQMSYQGGVWRKHLCETWLAGQGNPHIIDQWKKHPGRDAFWEQFDAENMAGQVQSPGLHIGGWWDIFAQGTINNFVTRQYNGGDGARGNQVLVMGPWAHGIPGPQDLGELHLPDNYALDINAMQQKFYRHWLLGQENDVMDHAVHYYTLGDVEDPEAPGNEWRTATDWPPTPTRDVSFYLDETRALIKSTVSSQQAIFTYEYDPANPCPTLGGPNLYLPQGPFDQRELGDREDVLVFRTAALEEALEITGRVRVRLFASTNGLDTDFTAKLVDVYPDGREILLLDGIRRMKFRNGFETPEVVKPGEVVPVEIDLWSISMVFNKGHRIGLHVSSSNYPRFEKNPNTGQDFPDENNLRVAINTVHCGSAAPSALILPVREEP